MPLLGCWGGSSCEKLVCFMCLLHICPVKLIFGDFCLLTDDSMAILMAFQTPGLEILGLTTVFGNVTTKDATRNALLLVGICFS